MRCGRWGVPETRVAVQPQQPQHSSISISISSSVKTAVTVDNDAGAQESTRDERRGNEAGAAAATTTHELHEFLQSACLVHGSHSGQKP